MLIVHTELLNQFMMMLEKQFIYLINSPLFYKTVVFLSVPFLFLSYFTALADTTVLQTNDYNKLTDSDSTYSVVFSFSYVLSPYSSWQRYFLCRGSTATVGQYEITTAFLAFKTTAPSP